MVRAIRRDPNINFGRDWKLVTIFIGNNDLCHACKQASLSTSAFLSRITAVLDYLKRRLPRAFISLLQPLNIYLAPQMSKNNFICRLVQMYACPCAIQAKHRTRTIVRRYHKALERLTASGRYDTKRDFTVVLQPFFEEPVLPPRSFLSVDCFHFSAFGHASAAVSYWNNLFSPVSLKRKRWYRNETFSCPSPERPFLYTARNSNEE